MSVTPAKAWGHAEAESLAKVAMDAGLRRHDEVTRA
jgi:hypothetical protein